MEMVIIYPVFIGIAIATAELAREKGYKGRWWFLLGMLIPVFSVLVLMLLKRREKTAGQAVAIPGTRIAARSDKILYQKPL